MTHDEHFNLVAIYEGNPWDVRKLLKRFIDQATIADGEEGGSFRAGMERAKAIVGELSVKPPQNPAEQMIYDTKAPVLAEFQTSACRLIDQELGGSRTDSAR